MSEHLPAVVVGGGQAGLAAGYYLRREGIAFAILDRHPRVGDSWRRRWATLRLFTPAHFDALPGLRFPAAPEANPGRDEMAAYLQSYAEHFDLPVRSGVSVTGLGRRGDLFVLETDSGSLTAEQVILATGANQKPRVPAWAAELAPDIKQLTAATYREPDDLPAGDVLVVGAGNSGSEIALEAAAAGHRVHLSGRDTGKGTARLFKPLPVWIGLHLLTTSTPMGRRMAARMQSGGAPRFWIEPADLERAGIQRVGRTVAAEGGLPRLAEGTVLDVTSIVWCTGFAQDFTWVDLPAFDTAGRPLHDRGVAVVPGLYFLGLPFQRSIASTLVGGADLDARHVVRRVARYHRRSAAQSHSAALGTAGS